MITPAVLTRKEQLDREISWKKTILQQYTLDNELQSLETTAQTIAHLAGRRSQIVRELLPATTQELEGIEADLLLDIAGRVDDKGKPLGTNAESRKALLQSGLNADRRYQMQLAGRIELQMESDQIEAELELEHRRHRAAQYAIEHKLASIRLLGL